MGNSANPALLKAWLSWLKSGLLLRLIGLPAAVLALHFEIYGSSYRYSVILHRLSSRLRLARLSCRLRRKGHESRGMTSLFYLGGADVMDRAPKPASSRKPSTTPDNKERAQPSGAAHTSAAAPQQPADVSSSETTPSHLSPSPTLDMHSHARSMSHADVVRQGKRLSLQFPIQPATAGSSSPAFSSPRSRPQSWITPAAPSPVPSPDAASAESNILSIIAQQERYVLELKEELSTAEQDLKLLKKQYATQEAVKQRNELRNVTKLQPLNTTLANYGADQDDEDGSSTWMQKEMERRKALLSAKTPQRSGKVFSGSRHLRALSLLSPDKSYTPSFPQPPDVRNDEPAAPPTRTTNTNRRPTLLARNSTSPDIANHVANTMNSDRYDLGGLPNIQRDALLRTGKQMATDFKDGFFTFIDDIRQATVGEDPLNAGESARPSHHARPAPTKGPRKTSEHRPPLQRAASSKKPAPSKLDIGDEFWKEHGLSEPKASPTHKKTHALKQTRTPQKQTQNKADDFDSWDSWETPSENHERSAKASEENDASDDSEGRSSPVSGQASSRTSTRYHSQRHDSKASTLTASSSAGLPDESSRRDSKRNSIPWPELSKLSPSQLKRTASHLMKEWEKNLTPPPEARDFNHASGDYIGRSGSPADFA